VTNKSTSRATVAASGVGSRNAARSHDLQSAKPLPRARSKVRRNGTSPRRREVPQVDVHYQNAIKNYEIGVRAFHKQNYDKAAEIFEKLVDHDARDVAERARVHLRLCRQRTGRPSPAPKSADGYYTLGIGSLNGRNLELAIEQLSKADKMRPNQDHIYYALAAAHALQGNRQAALDHLETAITLRNENRIHARRDEDFQELSSDPRFRRLIRPVG
jgi:tetratricopeptide (TPR) repeat protein